MNTLKRGRQPILLIVLVKYIFFEKKIILFLIPQSRFADAIRSSLISTFPRLSFYLVKYANTYWSGGARSGFF